MSDDCDPESIEEVLDCVEEAGNGDTRVAVSDIMEEIGDTAFAPLMLVTALVVISPASAVFGLSTVCGIMIALIAFQMAVGREKLWLPGFVRNRTIARKRLDTTVHYLSKPAKLIDAMTRKRLSFLTEPPVDRLWALLCMLVALLMPFMEVIPMSATVVASAIALFAVAMVAKDGLFVIFGLAVLGAAGWLVWSVAT